MNEQDFNDKKTKVSEFNEASYQILRLHNLWTKCNFYSTSGQLDKWKWTLDRVWVELAADAKDKDEEKYFEELDKLNKKISIAKEPVKIYNALGEKEIFLRCLQEAVGKGGKKTSIHDEEM